MRWHETLAIDSTNCAQMRCGRENPGSKEQTWWPSGVVGDVELVDAVYEGESVQWRAAHTERVAMAGQNRGGCRENLAPVGGCEEIVGPIIPSVCRSQDDRQLGSCIHGRLNLG